MELIEILKVLLLGIVEGITEWLPVSSTGHILLVDALFPLSAREEFKNVFLYVVQLGAILAVVLLFWRKLLPVTLSKKRIETSESNQEKTTLTLKKDTLSLWGKLSLRAYLPPSSGLFLIFPTTRF